MAIAVVQFTGITTGSTTSVTATNVNNVGSSSNSLVLVTQSFGINSLVVGTVTDTYGGTWTLVARGDVGVGTDEFQVWVCNNPQAGVKHAVTYTLEAADLYGSCAWLGEFSGGPLAIDPGDSSNIYAEIASGSSGTIGPLTPTRADSLFLASWSDNTGSSDWSITGSWNVITNDVPNGLVSYIATDSSAQSATWNISPSDSGSAFILALYSSAGSTGTAGLLLLLATL